MIWNLATLISCIVLIILFRRLDRSNLKLGKLRRYSNRVSKEYGLFYEPACNIQHLKSPISRINHRKRSLMLVRNHHYLFKKNLPQTLIHRLIHTWSMFGLAVKMILDRSYDGFIGILMGWNDVLRSSE